MRLSCMLAALLLLSCAAPAPAPRNQPPAFDWRAADACAQARLRAEMTALGEAIAALTPDAQAAMVQAAIEACPYTAASLRRDARDRLGFAASRIRAELEAPIRAARNAAAERRNSEITAARQRDLDAAGAAYLRCVRAAAGGMAAISTEAAPVIASAATGACPAERAAVARLDARMPAALDAAHEGALLAHIIRGRAAPPASTPD